MDHACHAGVDNGLRRHHDGSGSCNEDELLGGQTFMGYDIIGDIHGHADKLEALLRTLGYRKTAGAWRHPERQAIFVGDFVDRGPAQLRAIDTARRMVDAGAALAVMGNHELNAIAWHTPDARKPGSYLRSHDSPEWGEKNRKQHAAFLAEVDGKPALHTEIIDWFLTLPLWLDLPDVQVVHACWHDRFMKSLAPQLHQDRYLTRDLMVAATDEPDEAEKDYATFSIFKGVECLTRRRTRPRRRPFCVHRMSARVGRPQLICSTQASDRALPRKRAAGDRASRSGRRPHELLLEGVGQPSRSHAREGHVVPSLSGLTRLTPVCPEFMAEGANGFGSGSLYA